VAWSELRPICLAAQHRQLVPKQHDLRLPEALRPRAQEQELQQAAERQVAERAKQQQLLGISGTGRRLYGRVESSRVRTELTFRPHDLPTQDLELVAQHQQLDIFHMQAATATKKGAEQSAHSEVEE
jgi:hypothetical protein